MHSTPAKYLILIESAGAMVARLFDANRVHLSDFDAASEEVAVMTKGLTPRRDADEGVWAKALSGHNAAERAEAQVFTLDV
jgi:hypothetical protein